MNCIPTRSVVGVCCLVFLLVCVGCGEEPPVEALHPESGSVLWKYRVGGEIWSPLTEDRGTLYFGCDDGMVYALDAASQSMRWEFPTGGRVRSAVRIADGKALFASDDGQLYAVDSANGEESWRFDLGSAEIERRLPATEPPYDYDYRHSSPAVSDGVVFVGSADGKLYAVDLGSGQPRWSFETGGKIRATPLVEGGVVYVGSWDGALYAVDAGTGKQRWRFDTGGTVQAAAAGAGGMVVVGSRSATIFAVDAVSGESVWEQVHEDGSWVESPPVIVDGVVYIGSSDGLKLFALDLETGNTAWEFKTGGWSWGAPLVTDDRVYIGGVSAYPYYFEGVDLEAGFYAVSRETGALDWRMTPEAIEGYVTGGVFSTPVVADRVVYVGALDAHLYALAK